MYNYDVDVLKKLNTLIRNPVWESRNYSIPKAVETVWPTEASVVYYKDGVRLVEGSCNRAIWYRLNHYEPKEDIEDRMYWIWRMGKLIEEDANTLLSQSQVLVGKSLRFQDTSTVLPISGEMDSVCKFIDGEGSEKHFVIDFKTTGGNYFGNTQILGNTKVNPMPKIPNLLQIMVYLKVDPRFVFGKLVYFIRDNLVGNEFTIQLKEHQGNMIASIKGGNYTTKKSVVNSTYIDYPEYSIENIYARYNEVGRYYMTKTLPPPDYDIEYSEERINDLHRIGKISDNQMKDFQKGKPKGDYQCIGCKFAHHCIKDR